MKSIEHSFIDWEGHVFGYGYGTGEPYTLTALGLFFASMIEGNYDHRQIENSLGSTSAWLLINTLCHADILDYGTSPRHGWLTTQGKNLHDFVLSHTVDQLVKLTEVDQDYIHCYPDTCNCGPDGYQKGVICENPFWSYPL